MADKNSTEGVHNTYKHALYISIFAGLLGTSHSSMAATSFSVDSLEYYLKNHKVVTKAPPNSVQAKMGAQILDIYNSGMSKSLGSNNKLSVVVRAKQGMSGSLNRYLRQQGYQVQNQVDDNIYLQIAPNQLQPLAAIEMISSLDIQPKLSINDQSVNDLLNQIGLGGDDSNVTSHQDNNHNSGYISNNDEYASYGNIIPNQQDIGLKSMHVDQLHKKGIYGNNIKVGVIDFGYNEYDNMQSKGYVPKPVATQSFVFGERRSGLSTTFGTQHGTACTEIIYNLAPKAKFYLAQVGTGTGSADDGDVLSAIDWMVSQGVNVINFSGGGHGGPHNGHSSLDKKVDSVVGKGILWVNAAGNEGSKHWGGKMSDNNRNGIIDFDGKDYLVLESNGGPFQVTFNWDDWGDTSTLENIDLDGYLLDSNLKVVAEQEVDRNYNTGAIDRLTAKVPKGYYAFVLSTNKVSNKKLHVVVEGAKLRDLRPSGSIGIPATSKGALSVGAWDVTKKRIADYSSQGRTDDNRIKPEISAPSGVYSQSYKGVFDGTSAAAPYATGFAALVWSQNPSWTANTVKNKLQNNFVTPIDHNVPSIASGYGLLDARKVLNSSTNSSNNGSYTPPKNNEEPDQVVQDLLQNIGL